MAVCYLADSDFPLDVYCISAYLKEFLQGELEKIGLSGCTVHPSTVRSTVPPSTTTTTRRRRKSPWAWGLHGCSRATSSLQECPIELTIWAVVRWKAKCKMRLNH